MRFKHVMAALVVATAMTGVASAQSVSTAASGSNAQTSTDVNADAVSANDQSVTINSEAPVIPRERYQAPSVVAPTAVPSGNLMCAGAVSAGISIPGGSATLGRTYEDGGCARVRNYDALLRAGERQVALRYLCNGDEAVREAFADVGRSECTPEGTRTGGGQHSLLADEAKPEESPLAEGRREVQGPEQ